MAGARPSQEQLWGAHLRGPLHFDTVSGPRQFSGQTVLSSGSATVVVSTTLVHSDSIVAILSTQPSSIVTGAGSLGPVVVNSLVHGTSFTFTRIGGATAPVNTTISFLLINN